MPAFEAPAEAVARFRAQAAERLERIGQAWLQLVQFPQEPALAQRLHRDLHTLKGDTHLVGFHDAARILHKVEELLAIAEERSFHVADGFDLVVTMAIGFVGMLVRKKAGTELAGIDLPGFVRQVDEVIAEARARPAPASAPGPAVQIVAPGDRLSMASRARLARLATEAFLDAAATGHKRPRLERTWRGLVAELSTFESVRLDARLARHAQAARLLAGDLGKAVGVDLRLGSIEVPERIADVLDEVLVHVLRNAVDHGIEPVEERRRRAKSPRGVVVVSAALAAGDLELVIEDDGAGIDLHAVRRCAIERGLIDDAGAANLDPEAIVELLFAPGFSTRDGSDEVSGRGIGLDAVRTAVAAQGGRVEVSSTPGVGTRIALWLPQHDMPVPVLRFSTVSGLAVAVSSSWSAAEPATEPAGREPGEDDADALDIGAQLDLPARPDAPRCRVALVRGSEIRTLLAGAWPILSTAQRICRTLDEDPVEIVRFDSGFGLLLHDAMLGARAS